MKVDIFRFRTAPALSFTALLCTLALITVPAAAVDAPSKSMPVTDLAALDVAVQQATGNFAPITDEAICQAKRDLQQAASRLDTQFCQVGPVSEGWKKYLDWDALRSTIQSDTPDIDRLQKAYSALNASYRGLELSCFIDLRLALDKYMNLRLAADSPKIKKAYDKLMGDLPAMLKDHATAPTSNPSIPLQQIVAWLDKFDQAPELLATIRADFAKPNFYASASKQLIEPGFNEKIDEPVDVHDVILKTKVHSVGTMQGQTTLQLVPSETNATLEVLLTGTSETDNRGHRGPVWIHSDSTSEINATKPIRIDADGLQTAPAEAEVHTSTRLRVICTKNRCQMIEKFAWKQARKSKRRAQAISSGRTARRVEREIDEEADSKVARANDDYRTRFRLPLLHRKLFPDTLNFATTEDRLDISGMQKGLAQFAAWSDPPKVDATGSDAVVQIHESMINNSTWTFLSGRTFAEEEFLALITDLYGGELPEPFQPDEDQEPWAVTFAQENPVRITFEEGHIRVEIHATGFRKGNNDYTAMNIAATYKIENSDDQFVLTRIGDLEVFPPGFESESRKLSVREQTLRKLLEKRFSKIFEPTWKTRPEVPLPKRWKSAGTLHLTGWSTDGGWMTLTWTLKK